VIPVALLDDIIIRGRLYWLARYLQRTQRVSIEKMVQHETRELEIWFIF